ncbi:MAG: PTS sugar transporter subunit IIA [Lentisphaeria bacterium]|jgi:mannitol/fructose-specific phosphotransferase system IIA component (Ntr-type)
MDIKTLLPRSHVLLNLQADNRRGLLEQLALPMQETGIVANLPRFVDDVERREEQITTQIGRELAIPHARSTVVRRLGITIGLAAAPGIPFHPGAQENCRTFFLIAVPAFAPTAHLTLLQGLVHFINDARRMEKLRAATTPTQVLNLLAAYKWPA